MHKTNTRCEGLSTASCFLLGLAVGSAGALLLAPMSGEKVRRKISGQVAEGRRRMNTTIQQSLSQISDIAKEAAEMIEMGKKHLAEEGQRIETAIQAGREAYRSASSTP